MGKKLLEYYDDAKDIGGFGAQMRLAILTKIPSTKALTEMDSEYNIKLFQDALNTIKKEQKQN